MYGCRRERVDRVCERDETEKKKTAASSGQASLKIKNVNRLEGRKKPLNGYESKTVFR